VEFSSAALTPSLRSQNGGFLALKDMAAIVPQ
jgi:hypothetical protein